MEKLTQEQQLRLAALSQANANAPAGASSQDIIVQAKRFEKYIKGTDVSITNDQEDISNG